MRKMSLLDQLIAVHVCNLYGNPMLGFYEYTSGGERDDYEFKASGSGEFYKPCSLRKPKRSKMTKK